jgi:hypothetical protein
VIEKRPGRGCSTSATASSPRRCNTRRARSGRDVPCGGGGDGRRPGRDRHGDAVREWQDGRGACRPLFGWPPGERRSVGFELATPHLAALGPAVVAEVVLRYVAVGGAVQQRTLTLPVVVNAVSAQEAATLAPDVAVREQVLVLRATRARDEAVELLDGGGVAAAAALLGETASELPHAGLRAAVALAGARGRGRWPSRRWRRRWPPSTPRRSPARACATGHGPPDAGVARVGRSSSPRPPSEPVVVAITSLQRGPDVPSPERRSG